MVLTPLLTVPVLSAVGFSAAGPVAGTWRLFSYTTVPSCRTFFFLSLPPLRSSCYRVLGTIAAGIQSGIGNVVAGSLFATAQGAAMGAGTPILAQAIGGTVTGVMGMIAVGLGL